MCPLVKALEKHKNIKTIICTTGQHREMLQQVLDIFDVTPDYNLEIMKNNQTLVDITSSILVEITDVIKELNPDIVLVHGDTTTTFAAALACFYSGIKIGHVEAGLRTYNLSSPFPEEFNRQSVGIIADYHFAPTSKARENLLKEGKPANHIYVTGNTAIDALKYTIKPDFEHPILDWVGNDRLVILTAHRRENWGQPLHNIFRAIRRIVNEKPDVKLIYPIHMNPLVRSIAEKELKAHDRIKIIEPLDVVEFHNLLSRAYLVLTDSGGIQEEAPSFGIPVLVMRETTERPEGVEAGTLKLVGVDEEKIYKAFRLLLEEESIYHKMSRATNPYGDGFASERITDVLLNDLSVANSKEEVE